MMNLIQKRYEKRVESYINKYSKMSKMQLEAEKVKLQDQQKLVFIFTVLVTAFYTLHTLKGIESFISTHYVSLELLVVLGIGLLDILFLTYCKKHTTGKQVILETFLPRNER